MREKARRIVVVGGSTVHGEGDPAGGGFVGRFRAKFELLSDQHRVFNLGVGGDTASMMLLRAPAEVRVRRADLIICYPGLNDIKRIGTPSAEHSDLKVFGNQVRELMEALREIAPVVLMTAVPLDESR